MNKTKEYSNLTFVGERSTWFTPTSLREFLVLRAKYPHCRVIGGNTEVGIETQIRGLHYSAFLSPMYIDQMNKIEVTNDGIKFSV